MGNECTWEEEKKDCMFRLCYKGKKLPILVERSHEGYNHFSKWYVKYNGKIKSDKETKNLAMEYAIVLFWEEVGTKILESKP